MHDVGPLHGVPPQLSLHASSAPPHPVKTVMTVSMPVELHVSRESSPPAGLALNTYHRSLDASPPGSQLATPSCVAVEMFSVIVPLESTVAVAQVSFVGAEMGGAPGATVNW